MWISDGAGCYSLYSFNSCQVCTELPRRRAPRLPPERAWARVSLGASPWEQVLSNGDATPPPLVWVASQCSHSEMALGLLCGAKSVHVPCPPPWRKKTNKNIT